MDAPDAHRQVLFLCTGNYYRSRFAEILFNLEAEKASLAWRADSRGLRISSGNVGPISRHARKGLADLGHTLADDSIRFPIPLSAADLQASQHVVAVKEVEHRPLLLTLFPTWVDRVEYWHIHDLDCAEPCEALPLLAEHVRNLVRRLADAAGQPNQVQHDGHENNGGGFRPAP